MKRVRSRAIALILGLGLLVTGCSQETNTLVEEESYIPVETHEASTSTLTEKAIFSGKVFSEQEVAVIPKVPGKVNRVPVKVGDRVQAGQVLFTMDTSDYQSSLDSANIGIRSAEINYEMSKEQLEAAETNYERQKELYDAGAISLAQLESFETQLNSAKKGLELAEIQLEQAKLGLEQAQKTIADSTVTAPVSGTISAVNVVEGQMATQTAPAVTITKLDSLYVALNIPENMVNYFSPGQKTTVIINSAGKEELPGTITNISPAANMTTGLYSMKVTFESKDTQIKPGMFAKVEIPTQTKEDILTINSEAVVLKGGQYIVYVVEGERAVAKEVVTGLDTGAHVEVLEGLEVGEQVIIKGQTLVQDGSKVKVVGGSES